MILVINKAVVKQKRSVILIYLILKTNVQENVQKKKKQKRKEKKRKDEEIVGEHMADKVTQK